MVLSNIQVWSICFRGLTLFILIDLVKRVGPYSSRQSPLVIWFIIQLYGASLVVVKRRWSLFSEGEALIAKKCVLEKEQKREMLQDLSGAIQ